MSNSAAGHYKAARTVFLDEQGNNAPSMHRTHPLTLCTMLQKGTNVTVRSRRGTARTAEAKGLSRFAAGSRQPTHQPQRDGGTATKHVEGLQGVSLEDERTGQSRASLMAPGRPACGEAGRCREPAEDDPDGGPRTEVMPSGHLQHNVTKVISYPAIVRLILQRSPPEPHAANNAI